MAAQQAWNHRVDYTALIGTEIYFISWVPGDCPWLRFKLPTPGALGRNRSCTGHLFVFQGPPLIEEELLGTYKTQAAKSMDTLNI